MATLLGSLIALGILKRNRELIALETAGIKATSYVMPILLTALGLSLAHFLADETLARAMNHKAQQIWQREVLNQKASLAWSHENVWYRGQNVIYQIRLYNKEAASLEKVSLFYLNSQFEADRAVGCQTGPLAGPALDCGRRFDPSVHRLQVSSRNGLPSGNSPLRKHLGILPVWKPYRKNRTGLIYTNTHRKSGPRVTTPNPMKWSCTCGWPCP